MKRASIHLLKKETQFTKTTKIYMPFVETTLFENDKKKLKKINDLISKKISKVFNAKYSTITIYNNFIKKKNFYHNSKINNSEKRIFIKISGIKRTKNKKKRLAQLIISGLIKIIKVNQPANIAIYYYDRLKEDVYHGT